MAELYQLRQLVAIAEAGTMSKAAELVHLSQPALSRSMQKLESEWNLTLFDRQKNKITLNKAGELAVQHARRVLEDMDNLTLAIQTYERSLHTISIGSCAPGPILELLPFLTQHFFGMAVSSETVPPDKLLPALEDNTYQIIITDQPVEAPGILCQKLCKEQLFLTVPPAHPLASKKDGIWLEDLAGETMLLFKTIGIWEERTTSRMTRTTFIVQEQDDSFSALIQASALPAFASNLTMKNREPIQNRSVIPILDPEATITFYLSVKKANRAYLPT